MIESNRREHGDIGIDDVGRIQTTAKTDLDDGDIHLRVDKGEVCRQRAVFEKRQRHAFARRLDPLEKLDQRLIEDRRAIDGDAFVVALQMRRGVGASTKPGVTGQRCQIGNRRSFAVGTPNDHRRNAPGQNAESSGDRAYAVEAEFYRVGMLRLLMREPIIEAHRTTARAREQAAASTYAVTARGARACRDDRRSCRSHRDRAKIRYAESPRATSRARFVR